MQFFHLLFLEDCWKRKSFQLFRRFFLIFLSVFIFTFSSHTEYVKRESIVIAWVKKKILAFWRMFMICVLEDKTSEKKFPSVCMSVCLDVCLDVWLYVRTWTFHADTITCEGVSGSKQNLVGVFYVWNVGLVLKSKVKSWSWFKSWSWTEFWFS